MGRIRTLVQAAALATLVALTLRAQAQAPHGAAVVGPGLDSARWVPRTAYRLQLTSRWPQYGTGTGCENGGWERIEGTISRRSGMSYAGSLTRTSTILFCGAHGSSGGVCHLALEASGTVEAKAEAGPSGLVRAVGSNSQGPEAVLVWRSRTEAPGRVAVSGDCPEAFGASLRAMYLNARRSVELPLPAGPAGTITRQLDDFGWSVSVE